MFPGPKARSLAGPTLPFVRDQSRLPFGSYISAINAFPLMPATPIRVLSGEMTSEKGSSTAEALSKDAVHNLVPAGSYLINTESWVVLPLELVSHIRPAT